MENNNKKRSNFIFVFTIISISILLIIINIIFALLFPSHFIVYNDKISDKYDLINADLVKTENSYKNIKENNILEQNGNLTYNFQHGKLHVEFNKENIDVNRKGINKFEVSNSQHNKKIIKKMDRYYREVLPKINPGMNNYGIKIFFKNNTLNGNNSIIFMSNEPELLQYFVNEISNHKYLIIHANYFNGQISIKSINSIQENFNENNNDNIFIIKNKEQINKMLK